MATTKKRINISVSDAVEKAVATLAERDQVPQATKAGELIQLALEIEEDSYFAAVAKERLKKKVAPLSHKAAWS